LIDAMRQAAQRGSGLTRQLLAFSRRQPLNPQPIDLARQLGGMREMLDGSLRGDVEVRLALADDLWAVEVDPGELELALLNLAVNARDAMDNAGTIVVRAENAPGEMVDGKAGDFVRLTVCDTGIGMPPEVQARVFEPFFTTKDIGKGSGLGLAQVYGFAKQSGGTVRIESAIGKGTNVILLLPRSDAAPAPDQRTLVDVRPERPAALSSGWVLLVEDDDEVAALVADMLQQLGYQVTRVGSAAAALGALANGRKVDVVLSDVMMPGGMSGVDLAREIHGRCPGLPVLLSSGYAEAAARAAAIEGVSVLPKPYELGELDLALRQTRQGVAAARS
jgi:CheY-like chemotaxis protein